MLHGYPSTKGRGTGHFKKFKLSCYASRDAIKVLKENGWSGKGLRQEHVIPIKVVGDILVSYMKQNPSDFALLTKLKTLVIPCVIHEDEDKYLPKQDMPSNCNPEISPWDRYKEAIIEKDGSPDTKLYEQIVALRTDLDFPCEDAPAFAPEVMECLKGMIPVRESNVPIFTNFVSCFAEEAGRRQIQGLYSF
jgi:hypothetical protein